MDTEDFELDYLPTDESLSDDIDNLEQFVFCCRFSYNKSGLPFDFEYIKSPQILDDYYPHDTDTE